MAPPELMDDLIGEILLRLPPEDPECLVRASLVCKPWRRLLSDPRFPRRYREFHGVPPLLGFLHNEDGGRQFFPRFVPVKEASPILNPPPDPHCYILDCRHGRVLLLNGYNPSLIVWDPITNSRQDLGWPKLNYYYRYTAAVLCALDGCDHLGCCGGPFLVVFVVIDFPNELGGDDATTRTYSSETGTWTTGVSSVYLGLPKPGRKMIGSSLLARGALYFILENGRRILKYDLAGCGISVMSPPPLPVGNMVLMKAEGGGLGACGVEGHNLHLWAWRTGPNGIPEWERGRVIQLDIGDLSTKLDVVDFAEGAGSIFIFANKGVFAVDLKSGRARKIGKGGEFKVIFPFMSFYTPSTSLMPTDLFPQS
ncbi:unnamed protein product [Miscanthus lutarioriparius]|uniref:F-box domain-containing protein n=1 Tax=Miscanthus lutarioriparius TaxID=422564 RepID=A0A811Q5E5_9POAL|nr:unnamed protein product [Miscanthus lutarioriparius]